jgi:DNA topoisomerase VI subunit B
LRDERNGKWLLVLDNADDTRWLPETHATTKAVSATESHDRSTRPLWEYLPQSQHGSILVTTRSRNIALNLVEERDIIAVEPMDEVHAVALFDRKLLAESNQEDTVELVAALEFMPLKRPRTSIKEPHGVQSESTLRNFRRRIKARQVF